MSGQRPVIQRLLLRQPDPAAKKMLDAYVRWYCAGELSCGCALHVQRAGRAGILCKLLSSCYTALFLTRQVAVLVLKQQQESVPMTRQQAARQQRREVRAAGMRGQEQER